MTVDELRWYSRRKPQDIESARDNLCLESGSLKDVTSEYGYSFRPPALVARSLVDLASHQQDDKENINMRRSFSHSEDLVGKSVARAPHRVRLQPQGDLHPEGDMIFQTEKRDQFIEYVFSKRPDLLRRDTQLKLEGDLNTVTENRDKFIFFDKCQRPPLARRLSNLHLEGEFNHLPEYKSVFVEFPRHRPVTKKPELCWLHDNADYKMDTFSETLTKFIEHAIPGTKQEIIRHPSNLKCEGEYDFMGEYTKSYKQFPIERRPSLCRTSNLKLEGEMFSTPEYKDKYVSLPLVKHVPNKPADSLILDDLLNVEIKNNSAYVPSHADTNILPNPEGSLPVSTDNTAKLERPVSGRRAASPQYFTSDLRPYLDEHKPSENFRPRSGRKSPKPSSEDRLAGRPPRGRPSRASSQSLANVRHEQELSSKEEYKAPPDLKTREHFDLPKVPPRLKSPEIGADEKLFESQPEYRKAYTDYLIRERLPRHRSPDNAELKPPVNLKWIKRADHHRDPPFEVLLYTEGTRTGGGGEEKRTGPTKDESSYLYKPSSRRASTTSVQSPRRRSDSPSYRLHVTNVDEPKKGFGSRATAATRRPSKGYQNADWRPASPSRNFQQRDWTMGPRETGRKQWSKNNFQNDVKIKETPSNKSFVVLDQSIMADQARNYANHSNKWYRHSND